MDDAAEMNSCCDISDISEDKDQDKENCEETDEENCEKIDTERIRQEIEVTRRRTE